MQNKSPYLAMARLHNFQSWKESTTIQFKPGLNCIIGDNEVGKSVFFKVLKLACAPSSFTKKDAFHLITDNESFGRAIYIFSDMQGLVFTFTRKYQFFYEYFPDVRNSKVSEKSVGQPPAIFLQLLSIIKEPKSEFLANVIDSERKMLLIDSKADDNYNLFELICHSDGITNTLNYLQEVIPSTAEQYKRVYRQSLELARDLENTKAVNETELQKSIIVSEKLLALLKSLIKCNNLLTNVKIDSLSTKLKTFERLIVLLSRLKQTNILEKSIPKEIDVNYPAICNWINKCQNTNILKAKIPTQNTPEYLVTLCQLFSKLTPYTTVAIPKRTLPRNILSITKYLAKLQNTGVTEVKCIPNNQLKLSLILSEIVKKTQSITLNNKLEKYTQASSLIALLSILEKVSQCTKTIETSLDKQKAVNASIVNYRSILKELRETNKVLSCPVHGQIILKDEVCIPVKEVT